MQISRLENGILRVLMSDAELLRFGSDFSSLQENDPRTQTTVKRILKVVCAKEGFPFGTALTVEAVPTDSGCLLLITPPPIAPKNDGIHIFAPPDAAVLPKIADVLQRTMSDGLLACSLYSYEQAYRLLVYAPHMPVHTAALLSELAPFVGGGKIQAAHIMEYGAPLFVGNALETLQSVQ